ncbi:MAG: tRNA pseudouridine(38-40) synthase TruA [Planctomycetota bacterium]
MGGLFRITVAYDGTAYAGWQVQPARATVQGVLEGAAERLNGEATRVPGASRTDAGVHARGQACRFESRRDLTAADVPGALNAFLPEDVVVLAAVDAAPDFHPVRDARGKHYRYTFRVSRFEDPFTRRYALRLKRRPDVDAMRRAAGLLAGTHDFRAFEKAGSPREHTVRTLSRLDVTEEGEYIHVDLLANGFLYGMARNLAGTLLRVGERGVDAAAPSSWLAEPRRGCAGPILAPHGLCLVKVFYDDPNGGSE